MRYKGHKGALGVMETFVLFIVAMVSWVYTYSKLIKLYPLNGASLLYEFYLIKFSFNVTTT